jgi:hypothetical protein
VARGAETLQAGRAFWRSGKTESQKLYFFLKKFSRFPAMAYGKRMIGRRLEARGFGDLCALLAIAAGWVIRQAGIDASASVALLKQRKFSLEN